MDKKDPTDILRRLSPPIFKHLKPLSVYSWMNACDHKADLHQPRSFPEPLINFKFEVIKGTNKRKLHGSSTDECYVTPLKKPFSPKSLSPDLGCFVDYCSPLARQESASPFATSNPPLIDKMQDVGSEIKETVSSQLLSEDAKRGSSTDPGGKKETRVQDLMCERVLLSPPPAFDYDVDDILCLNPDSPAGFLDDEESCMSPSCQTFQDEPFTTVRHSEEVETADRRAEGRRDEVKKEICLNVKDVEDDGGYSSLSFISDHKGGGLANSEQLTANSNAHLRRAEGDCHPESSSKPRCHEQTATSGRFPIIVDNLSPTDSGPLLQPVNSDVGCLESCDVEEVWDIGPPIFESSVCHSDTGKLKVEQSSQVLEEVQECVTKSIHVTLAGEDTAVDTSYEATLPLQVQVKSKVVVPRQHPISSSPVPVPNAEATKPNANTLGALQPAKHLTQRPVVYSSEVEWEHQTRLYVHSVVSHIYENPRADNGVTSELLNLMSCVADESAGVKGREWQHPSDLTRRNYRKHFGTAAAEITLDEWRAKNCERHKCFDKVPKIFERSPCP